jgi:hypothetical protein
VAVVVALTSFGMVGCASTPAGGRAAVHHDRSGETATAPVPVAAESFSGTGPGVVQIEVPPQIAPDSPLWLSLAFDCDGLGSYAVVPTGNVDLGARGVRCAPADAVTYRYRIIDVTVPASLTITVDSNANWTLETRTMREDD